MSFAKLIKCRIDISRPLAEYISLLFDFLQQQGLVPVNKKDEIFAMNLVNYERAGKCIDYLVNCYKGNREEDVMTALKQFMFRDDVNLGHIWNKHFDDGGGNNTTGQQGAAAAAATAAALAAAPAVEIQCQGANLSSEKIKQLYDILQLKRFEISQCCADDWLNLANFLEVRKLIHASTKSEVENSSYANQNKADKLLQVACTRNGDACMPAIYKYFQDNGPLKVQQILNTV